MAVGELITKNYQVEYDGVVFGGGEKEVVKISGLFSSPEIRSTDSNRPLQHGTFPGNDYYGARTIIMDIEIWGDDAAALAARTQEVLAATIVRQREIPLVIRVGGWADDLVLIARPRDRGGFDITHDSVRGNVMTGSVMFVASDPRLLLGTQDKVSIIELDAAPTEGLTFPLTFPLTFGAIAVDGVGSVLNIGSADANVVLTVSGEITNPSITATAPDGSVNTLKLIGSFLATDVLTFDSSNRTILKNGNINQYSLLQDSGGWFDLQPGTTTIEFNGNSAGSPTLTVAWRDSYL